MRVSRLIIQPHLCSFHLSPAHSLNCFVPCLLFSLLSPPSGPSLSSSGRTCPWPLPHSENSEARLLSPTHSFSALLEVRCKPGFTLPSGLDATIRRCQGDRQWSGDEPICTGRFEVMGKCSLVLSGFFLTGSGQLEVYAVNTHSCLWVYM